MRREGDAGPDFDGHAGDFPEPGMIERDLRFMDRCLTLAATAGERGESAVGSVVVVADRILGEGLEETRARRDPTAHAEILAIHAACEALDSLDLSGTTLYTTVEPCLACAYAIRATGIARVVYGIPAGEVGSVGSEARHPLLADTGFRGWGPPPTVTSGIRATRARALRESSRRTG